MEKITFCIPSKSNLRYLKTCIPSIRKNSYRKDHDIIIFVDSDEDGTIKWLEEIKDKYNISYHTNPDLGNSLYGIGKAYDFCIEKSTTDIFMVFHADMMLGKDADLKAFNHLGEKTVVCATRIEPPLHPNNGEKILLDFGMYPEEFKENEFDSYIEEYKESDRVTEGIFAPWMMYKQEFMSIGGHDPILHSCREDSDVFNRMSLAGFKFFQPWNSLVYHLTGRGAGSFEGDGERHNKWKEDMNKSTKEFIRKWGSNVKHTPLMKPIVPPKYDIGIKLKGGNSQLLEILEPWCSNICLDDEMQVITSHYIDKEQSNTIIDLSKKIIITPFQFLKNEIIIEIDQTKFTQQDFQIIQQLPEIIKDSGEIGKFQLGNIFIDIRQMNEYQNKLIKI
jgi:glycosyltransferase involved in cell wall biosynthesis